MVQLLPLKGCGSMLSPPPEGANAKVIGSDVTTNYFWVLSHQSHLKEVAAGEAGAGRQWVCWGSSIFVPHCSGFSKGETRMAQQKDWKATEAGEVGRWVKQGSWRPPKEASWVTCRLQVMCWTHQGPPWANPSMRSIAAVAFCNRWLGVVHLCSPTCLYSLDSKRKRRAECKCRREGCSELKHWKVKGAGRHIVG